MYTPATLDADLADIRTRAKKCGHRWLSVKWWGETGDVELRCLACNALKVLPVHAPLLDLPSYDGRALTETECLRTRGWVRQLIRWLIA